MEEKETLEGLIQEEFALAQQMKEICLHKLERLHLICEALMGFLTIAAFNNPTLLISAILLGLLRE